jgi:hypothetical protein
MDGSIKRLDPAPIAATSDNILYRLVKAMKSIAAWTNRTLAPAGNQSFLRVARIPTEALGPCHIGEMATGLSGELSNQTLRLSSDL